MKGWNAAHEFATGATVMTSSSPWRFFLERPKASRCHEWRWIPPDRGARSDGWLIPTKASFISGMELRLPRIYGGAAPSSHSNDSSLAHLEKDTGPLCTPKSEVSRADIDNLLREHGNRGVIGPGCYCYLKSCESRDSSAVT